MVGLYSGAALLSISPVTPLHPGVGRAGGAVDLPVQRDSLGYPVIFASSLKGALKSHLWRRRHESKARELFGSEPGEQPTKPGSLSLTDGFLLFMPARSAKGNPVMLTCPMLAERVLGLMEAVESIGSAAGLEQLKRVAEAIAGQEPAEGEVLVWGDRPVLDAAGDKVLIVNGEVLRAKRGQGENFPLDVLPRPFSKLIPERVVVLSNEDSLRVIDKSLLRVARVRLKRREKVVETGGLWSEEYVPEGAIFVAGLMASGDVLSQFRSLFFSGNNVGYLVLGGDESVGRGIVKLSVLGGSP